MAKTNNQNLRIAKKEKDDEYYTYLKDIENELKNYKNHFKGKVVYCNCDDPEWSNFFIYFKNNFKHLELKKLILTHYSTDLKKDKAYKLECLEYLLNKEGIPTEKKTYLEGNGDFRSSECLNLLKESDIVCTNPPFSLFIEYVSQLIEYNKKFLIIGNANAITYKQVFNLIQKNKIWLGVSPRSMSFYKNIERTESKKVNACWFTNLTHKKRNENIVLWQKYSPDLYPKYDNFEAIEVSKTNDIPIDYKGIMGVPITFLEKYNPNQFKIIGIAKRGAGDIKLRNKIYTKQEFKNYSDLNAGPVIKKDNLLLSLYPRILIEKL